MRRREDRQNFTAISPENNSVKPQDRGYHVLGVRAELIGQEPKLTVKRGQQFLVSVDSLTQLFAGRFVRRDDQRINAKRTRVLQNCASASVIVSKSGQDRIGCRMIKVGQE